MKELNEGGIMVYPSKTWGLKEDPTELSLKLHHDLHEPNTYRDYAGSKFIERVQGYLRVGPDIIELKALWDVDRGDWITETLWRASDVVFKLTSMSDRWRGAVILWKEIPVAGYVVSKDPNDIYEVMIKEDYEEKYYKGM